MFVRFNLRYGDPSNYDVEIDKSGEMKQTRYSIVAMPPEKLDPAIKKLADETVIDLEALFAGADPFIGAKGATVTDTKEETEDIPF